MLLVSIWTVAPLVLLTPLIVNAPPFPHTFFPFIVGKSLFARTLIEIMVGLWLILAIRFPAYRVPRSWVLLLFAIWVGVGLLASLLGVSPQRSLWSTYERMQGWVDLFHWLAFAVVVSSVFRSWPSWRTLLNFNLAVSVALGLMGLAQYFDINVLSYLKPSPRIDITLGNPTYVGGYMLVSVLIALGFLGHSMQAPVEQAPRSGRQRRRGRARRREATRETGSAVRYSRIIFDAVVVVDALILLFTGNVVALVAIAVAFVTFLVLGWWREFWIGAVVLDVFILLLSGSRGALLGLLAGLLASAGVYAFWGPSPWFRRAAAVSISVMLGLLLVVAIVRDTQWFSDLASSSVTFRRIAGSGLDDSMMGRINAAKVSLNGVADRPLLGWGPENFTIAYDRYVTGDIVANLSSSFDQAHNKLVEELVTKGSLGLLAYLALWLVLFGVVLRRARQQAPHDQVFTWFIGAALFGYFVQLLFLFDTPGTIIQFMLLLSYAAYIEVAAPVQQDTPASAASQQTQSGRSTRSPATLRAVGAAFNSFILASPDDGSRRRREFVGSTGWLAVQATVAVLIVLAVVYFLTYRTYAGSRLILETIDKEISWEQRLDYFDQTIRAFPPLANYPRLVMFNQLTTNWRTLNQDEAQLALERANKEGLDALVAEPDEWRVHATLAGLYQAAAIENPPYVEKARVMVDAAAELAPERLEIQRLLAKQHLIENDLDSARELLETYVATYPNASSHFENLMADIRRASSQ